jgi:tRNA U34 5-carboxymethylaminomethyl modifying GTPase MnmE/TrmE
MLLKNHLIEVFKKASSENNILLKENIILKWVHRFGIDSLNDLFIHVPDLREYKHEDQEQITLINELDEEENQEQTTLMNELDENQEQITLMNKLDEEQNQEQIKVEVSKTLENIEETKWELNHLETSISNGIFNKDQNSNNIKEIPNIRELPLPNIKNLRKWINKNKKAS